MIFFQLLEGEMRKAQLAFAAHHSPALRDLRRALDAGYAPRWAISCFFKTNAGLTKPTSPQSTPGQDFDIQRVKVRVN